MDRRSRKTSIVWNHFVEIEQTDETTKRAKCRHCLRLIYLHNGNVCNLARHLKRKHPAINLQYEKPYREDSLSSLDKSNSEVEEKQDKYENATVHNDKYEKVYVVSREDTAADDSGEEYEYLEEIAPPKKKKQKYNPPKIKPRYNRSSNYREPQRRDHSNIDEDRSDVFGRLVTLKMRGLDKNQRLIAEKLINDTLHEAELGNLNKYCCISAVQMIHAHEEPATNDEKNVTVTTNTDTT